MKRYSISLVYIRSIKSGYETDLRALITTSTSKEEALGKALDKFKEEVSKKYLSNYIVLEIK